VALLKKNLDVPIVKVKNNKRKLKKAMTAETNGDAKNTTNDPSLGHLDQPWYAPNFVEIKGEPTIL
jgi:hypothetical protein